MFAMAAASFSNTLTTTATGRAPTRPLPDEEARRSPTEMLQPATGLGAWASAAGERPFGTRWVGGDRDKTVVRSRLVVQETRYRSPDWEVNDVLSMT